MEYKVEKKSAPGREEVEVLGATFEKGEPNDTELGKWRQKVDWERVLRFLAENGKQLRDRQAFGFCEKWRNYCEKWRWHEVEKRR